ncbi:MAG: DUF642 domain-containing protein [Bradyrhizobium sp.]|uniref:DUF642 domain-containing protein n=1 Tax=Bradyrhizobium sp. TaxID=376 RepID=UPI0025BB1A03|nr:DUF642 domain-containing protein [Bradyrhizobium sp.]MBI5263419.1 DUF642 domain-containing protein [Bradyrhizobium sp.]
MLKTIASGLLLLAFGSGTASANLLLDGGFDSPSNPVLPFYTNFGPVVGPSNYGGVAFDNAWQITSGNVDLVQQSGGWPASPASSPYYLDLTGFVPGTIQQTFATTAGQQYSLSFWYSNNPGGSPHPTSASVQVGSLSTTISHDGSTTSDLHWTQYYSLFTAAAGPTSTLIFAQLDNCCNGGILLDTVNVSAVPEPATWAMMVMGFLGLGFLAYRRSAGAALRIV